MCEEFSYQIITTQLSIKLSFVVIRSLQKSLQKRKHQCWRQRATERYTCLNSFKRDLANLFRLLQVSLSFSTFLFSTGIKLFIRHLAVLFGTLMLSERFDNFVPLPPWCILKDRQNKWSTEFYIPLSLGQGGSGYRTSH